LQNFHSENVLLRNCLLTSEDEHYQLGSRMQIFRKFGDCLSAECLLNVGVLFRNMT